MTITKFVFLVAILKRNIFWMFFLLIYGCPRCIQVWCKIRTEIPTGKYLKMVGSKWILSCAQTGVKSSLGTKVLKAYSMLVCCIVGKKGEKKERKTLSIGQVNSFTVNLPAREKRNALIIVSPTTKVEFTDITWFSHGSCWWGPMPITS